MFKRSAPLLLLALVACESAEAPDLDSLVLEGGCGDVLMYVGSEDRSLILVAHAELVKRRRVANFISEQAGPGLGVARIGQDLWCEKCCAEWKVSDGD